MLAALSYEIQIQGYLGDDWSEWFEGLRVDHITDAGDEGVRTILSGTMDQAMLHGVLLRVFSLGLPLIGVCRANAGDRADRRGEAGRHKVESEKENEHAK
jgi:hypothetical protein